MILPSLRHSIVSFLISSNKCHSCITHIPMPALLEIWVGEGLGDMLVISWPPNWHGIYHANHALTEQRTGYRQKEDWMCTSGASVLQTTFLESKDKTSQEFLENVFKVRSDFFVSLQLSIFVVTKAMCTYRLPKYLQHLSFAFASHNIKNHKMLFT